MENITKVNLKFTNNNEIKKKDIISVSFKIKITDLIRFSTNIATSFKILLI